MLKCTESTLHGSSRRYRHAIIDGPKLNKAKYVKTSCAGVVFFLGGLLVLCNFLWIYSAEERVHKSICHYESETWGYQNNETVRKFDYQKVRGSGSRQISLPLTIPNDTVLYGTENASDNELRFVALGISTVGRKENYLFRTLNSILNSTSAEEKADYYILILIADADPNVRLKRSAELYERYKEYIDGGLIRILQPYANLYPTINFSQIRRTYNDPVERVQWRTKQVLDFAFLFWYSYTTNIAEYFMVLEDDIISAKHFVTATKDFVKFHSTRQWISLQLSGFLGIGRLFRSSQLDRLVYFLLDFFLEHPVDMLMSKWIDLMAPEKAPKDAPYRRIPGLFQHIGIHSTLANKKQQLKDKTFSMVKRRFGHVNPSADIVTTIKQYKSFMAEYAYSSAPGMFWGIAEIGDTFDIIFLQPLSIARIVIITGKVLTVHRPRGKGEKFNNRLRSGHVEVSSAFSHMLSNEKASCENFAQIGTFQNGEFDQKNFPEKFPEGIQCIRIVVEKKQVEALAISEIAIFTMDEDISELKSLPTSLILTSVTT